MIRAENTELEIAQMQIGVDSLTAVISDPAAAAGAFPLTFSCKGPRFKLLLRLIASIDGLM